MRIVVITGGIGSGKSSVARIFKENDIPVYDCDSKVKEIYKSRPDLASLVTKDIFRDAGRLETLEKVLFPVLEADFMEWAEKTGKEWVAMESATILDKTYFEDFPDKVIFVDAPERIRLQRALSRGGISEDSIKERMALQKVGSSDPRVDFVLENDASPEDLKLKVEEILKKIKNG